MKIARTGFVIMGGLLLTITAFGYFYWYKPKFNPITSTPIFSSEEKKGAFSNITIARIWQKALLAKAYVNEHKFNKQFCFLIDMRLSSGKKRFFVYNLQLDSVEIAGLVTHGSGSQTVTDELAFSNIPNSHCTSLGKYKTGKSYYGSFGLAYKLYGLDKTNDKAFNRFVVLHAHNRVPDFEIAPSTICVSYGCPTVSPAFLTKLKTYLDQSQQPVLLWIYY